MLPVPATFVVDRDGIVRARYIDPDYRRRMELDDIVAAVAALGAGDSHQPGERRAGRRE
jgi:peroxiredoxin